ncbi:hypothetical protein MF672_013910 [Actinomadura sp. ATCC 31491]|uniref:Sensor histidine kinase n=1 Tax=Actinomadura luzonensis TaxID=2805427 RepID=A0ABT0FRD4_9ACTN|nr:hypothetical protein [Actinomadura luzonensis]MCK2214877.1 hypothetical protein [Actinomadura luzonensis]
MMDIPLRLLGWAVHLTAFGLLAIAVVTVLHEDQVGVAAAGVLLGIVYAAGPSVEDRPVAGQVWLAAVTALWLALAVAAAPFVWPVFPLLFAYVRMLPLWLAMFGVGTVTAVAVLAAAWHAGELTMPLVAGPGLAAAVVTLLALACQAMRAEAARALGEQAGRLLDEQAARPHP